jgi:hypothetical protein
MLKPAALQSASSRRIAGATNERGESNGVEEV